MSAFLDTNVLVYWIDDHPFSKRAEALITRDNVISVQVLNEFSNVLRNKRGMAWPDISNISQTLQNLCKVCDLTLQTHRLALYLADRYQFKIYDASIISAAAQMRCDVVYSEDMQHGMGIQMPAQFGGGSLSIKNPFL
jgi:predicted nucleic acid-binding protein